MTSSKKIKKIAVVVLLVILQTTTMFFAAKYFWDKHNFSQHNKELGAYFSDNHSSSFDLLETDKYDVFLSGESHATQKNFDIEFGLIKYLSENANLKYILTEDTFANSAAINEYLKTGNISMLDEIFHELKGTFVGNREHYDFLQKLYEFNKNLPDDKKLTYLGIDVEHQFETAQKYLKNLIKGKEDVSEDLKKFHNSSFFTNSELEQLFEKIDSDIKNNSEKYQKIFKENYFRVKTRTANYFLEFLKETDRC